MTNHPNRNATIISATIHGPRVSLGRSKDGHVVYKYSIWAKARKYVRSNSDAEDYIGYDLICVNDPSGQRIFGHMDYLLGGTVGQIWRVNGTDYRQFLPGDDGHSVGELQDELVVRLSRMAILDDVIPREAVLEEAESNLHGEITPRSLEPAEVRAARMYAARKERLLKDICTSPLGFPQ